MNTKMIAMDLDGTLLDSRKQLSLKVKTVLKDCADRGIHVVLASGRARCGVDPLAKELSVVRYVLTTNGGGVWDLQQNRLIYSRPLDRKVVLDLIDLVAPYPVMYDVYVDGIGKSETKFLEHLEDYGVCGPIRQLVLDTRELVPGIRQYVEAGTRPVEKMNLFFADMDLRRQIRKLLMGDDRIAVTSALENNLEINARGTDKGDGLSHLAGFLHVSREEIVAFGDGENDIAMLQFAGLGVAMENSANEVKLAADVVTMSNDQDGVAYAIEKYILQEEDR